WLRPAWKNDSRRGALAARESGPPLGICPPRGEPRTGNPRGRISRPQMNQFTAFFSCEPALNFGTFAAAICTGSPVRGLTPWRAARRVTWNLPKPVNVMASPFFSVPSITSRAASTAEPASRLVMPALSATASTNSCLVTFDPPWSIVLDSPARAYNPRGFGSTMRVHPLLPLREQIARPVERGEPHADPRKGVCAPLLAVDDAHRVADDEPGCANGFHRLAEGAARRDHVLDEAHELTRLVRPLDAVPGGVFLGFTAHDDEG